jgi:hypothetical protein
MKLDGRVDPVRRRSRFTRCVPWIAATGKATVCQTISRWTGVPIYDMDDHVYGHFMSRYSASRHPASSAWFTRRDGLAVFDRTPGVSIEELSRAVMRALGLGERDSSAG